MSKANMVVQGTAPDDFIAPLRMPRRWLVTTHGGEQRGACGRNEVAACPSLLHQKAPGKPDVKVNYSELMENIFCVCM